MTQLAAEASQRTRRVARTRRYLMCPPTHFDVVYSINPWMNPDKPVDGALARLQWDGLLRAFLALGHQVEFIEPLPGYPDMVFAANGATVINGKVLSARFRYEERAAEGPAYLEWFRARGYETREAVHVNEGEGDYLHAGRYLLAGTGFRTDIRSHREAERFFGMPVAGLRLVDPHFYHLDTALAVLGHDQIMYYPGAFSKESQGVLRVLYPDAIIATEADAEVFGLNAVSDGRHVLMPPSATHLMDELRERGYEPIGVELSELLKSGGSAKCCTLELRAGRS
ncbi:dimethylargininase [Streptosporangium amethystogenes]|uniref:dimethylargininase n=1 Tax=Streptosporangium amethystogenes TaxID=2002 RepID=UPI0004C547DA|nr:dimethylargininase [Streptosporangium amethystogenes]